MTDEVNITGREPYSDQQYTSWLGDMAPFLKLGQSLYYAIEKADLVKHKDSIYRKYRLKDWFCEKIEAFQKYPGEIVNSIFSRLILVIDDKIKQGVNPTDEEWRNLRFYAEKHRSCQQYFVTRQEVAQVEQGKVGQILDALEAESSQSDYEELAEKAKSVLNDEKLSQ